MCKRNPDNSLTVCKPAEATFGRHFYLGSWVSRDEFHLNGAKPVQCPAIKSGAFSKGAGIKINFCPFTGDDIQTLDIASLQQREGK